MELICTTCKESKDVLKFSKKNKTRRGYSYKCKECHNEYSRSKWYPKNQKRQIIASNKWKNENKLKVKANKYKIDLEEAKRLFGLANGKCQICKEDCDLCLDHCHSKGHIRGFLCAKCNTGIAMFRDNITILKSAIDYLTL